MRPPLRPLLFAAALLLAANALAAAYPDTLAGEVALYPGAHVDEVSSENGGSNVVLSAKGSVEAIIGYYRQQLTNKGWKEMTHGEVGKARSIKFTRNDRTLGVSVIPTEVGVTIAISLSK